jgi:hypothetical protein
MRATLIALFLVAACGDGRGTPPRQVAALWPEGHRLYIADSRQGVVHVFATHDAPHAVGEARAPSRHAVFDLELDAAQGRLWVLGNDALYLYDPASLMLRRRYPITGITAASRLALDAEGKVQIDRKGGAHERRM